MTNKTFSGNDACFETFVAKQKDILKLQRDINISRKKEKEAIQHMVDIEDMFEQYELMFEQLKEEARIAQENANHWKKEHKTLELGFNVMCEENRKIREKNEGLFNENRQLREDYNEVREEVNILWKSIRRKVDYLQIHNIEIDEDQFNAPVKKTG